MTVVVNVLRIAEPPLPATLAIIRAVAPDTVVVVDPTMTADEVVAS